MSESNHINDIENQNGGTIQFSINKTKHVNLKKPAKRIRDEELEQQKKEQLEEEMLLNQTPATEFEDVFSDEEKAEEDSAVSSVVSVEDVFKQNAEMINENFHDGTAEDEAPQHSSKLKKAAIIVGIISGAIILAAIAIGIIIIL